MKRVQIIKCKCGEVFAGCVEPDCYTDKDWTKNLKEYVEDGCTVDMVNAGEFAFGSCKCDENENN